MSKNVKRQTIRDQREQTYKHKDEKNGFHQKPG